MAVRDIGVFVGVVLAIAFAFRDALAGMVHVWNVSPMYSYGFTVPAISAYLLWTRRGALEVLTPKPSWVAGASLGATAALMGVVADQGSIQVLAQLAFLVALAAGVCLVLGTAYLKVAWAAFAYLLLMIPMWDGLTETLHQPFQERSAAIGLWLLQAIGVPAYREGTVIGLPALTIEVARQCSGVNYLVAVLALGLPMSYVYLTGVWRRALLLTSALVIAALSNGLRVALIGLLAHLDVGSPLHGPFHMLHGLFVAGIGYVVLFVGLRLLAARPSARPDVAAPVRPFVRAFLPAASVRAACAFALAFALAGVTGFASEPREVRLDGAFDAFPERLGGWTSAPGADVADLAAIWPEADSELRRRYWRADGAVADVYVAYYASQRQGREIVSFRAAGLQARARRVQLEQPASGLRHVNAVAPGVEGGETWFWYQVDRTPESNAYTVKARTLWNAVWRGRSNGAVVVIRTASTQIPGALAELAPLVDSALVDRVPAPQRPAAWQE
jgi:EpsI family protein